jgi:hypothetical protein
VDQESSPGGGSSPPGSPVLMHNCRVDGGAAQLRGGAARQLDGAHRAPQAIPRCGTPCSHRTWQMHQYTLPLGCVPGIAAPLESSLVWRSRPLESGSCPKEVGTHLAASCISGEEAAQRAAAAAAAKPAPQAADALRQEFIVSKYVRRLYGPLPHMLPGGSPQAALWDAAENGDVRCVRVNTVHRRVGGPGS